MVNLVARVKDPYASDPPLAVGLFVSAEILGRRIQGAYVIPRSAVREDADGTHVLVVDGEDRIRIRAVKVLRSQRDSAVIGAGLVGGERVCVSPLASAIDGMLVRVVEAAPEEVSEATL
jgi:multidrug efflux pump subunit AcrA (membrane-fusion protein)